MSQKNGVSWRVVVLTLITVFLFLGAGTAAGQNPGPLFMDPKSLRKRRADGTGRK